MSFRQKVVQFFLIWALVIVTLFCLGLIIDVTLIDVGQPEFVTKMSLLHFPLVLIGSFFITLLYFFVHFVRELTWGFKREKDSHFPGRHQPPPKK